MVEKKEGRKDESRPTKCRARSGRGEKKLAAGGWTKERGGSIVGDHRGKNTITGLEKGEERKEEASRAIEEEKKGREIGPRDVM